MLPTKESLTVEFKSERQRPQTDDEIVDNVVAMANTEVQKADGARAMGEAQSGYCQVLAPFSGHVAKVHVKPFQTVSAGTPLFDLVTDGALKVQIGRAHV